MIKLDNTQKIWITSDTHAYHKNICRGTTDWRLPDGSVPVKQTRDFTDEFTMTDIMCNKINDVVGQDDILIHLGDWSFGGFENIKIFKDRVVCQNIHLILGNHDHHIEKNRDGCRGYFKSVSHYENMMLKLEKETYNFVLMHYPISSWDNLNNGVIHLHGHTHLPTNMRFGKGRRMDVGIDGHPDFRPYDLVREVLPLVKKRDILSEMPKDHHTDRLKGVVG
jgi:calcineurin-like phosphoesterase family protein